MIRVPVLFGDVSISRFAQRLCKKVVSRRQAVIRGQNQNRAR